MFSPDIQDIIVSYVNNLKDLLSWRHTCHNNFNDFTVYFHCKNVYPFITPTSVELCSSNRSRKNIAWKNRDKILKIILYDHHFNCNELYECINLEKIYINGPIGSLDIQYCLSSVKELCLYNQKNYSIYRLNNLSKIPNLEVIKGISIDLSINQEYTNVLSQLHKLKYIDIKDKYSQNLDLSFIKNLHNLEVLIIDTTKNINLNNENVQYFTGLSKLRILKIGNNGVNHNISSFLPNLEILNCGEYEYTDSDIMNRSCLSSLKCGTNCFFTDLSFGKMFNLRELYLNNAEIMVSSEVFSKLTNLEKLHCGKTQIPNIVFKNFTKLIQLECGKNIEIDDGGLKYLTSLRVLAFNYNEKFTDDGLSYLTSLETVNLGKSKNITDKCIIKIKSLQNIYLDRETSISYFNYRMVRSHKKVKFVSIDYLE